MTLWDKQMENRRTLDSRTFMECSQRMQIITPPQVRKSWSLDHSPSSMLRNGLNAESSKERTKSPPETLANPSRITVKAPTPTPPPRKLKVKDPAAQQKAKEGKKELESTVLSKKSELTDTVPGFATSNLPETHNASLNARDPGSIQNTTSFQTPSNKNLIGVVGVHLNLEQKPVRLFLNWMSNIANAMGVQYCPPM